VTKGQVVCIIEAMKLVRACGKAGSWRAGSRQGVAAWPAAGSAGRLAAGSRQHS